MKSEIHQPVPVKGQRILLRGFDDHQEAEVRISLLKQGYQVATSIALADIVVVGTGNSSAAVEAARKAGIVVAPWTEFTARLTAAATPVVMADSACHLPIEIQAGFVRILDQVLPRAGGNRPLVPAAEQFRHLCLDDCLLRNARAVALGVRHGLPVALEGDTAASKTTAVLWVAHLIGQPVVRLNLHGQSDTGELIGRYVPGGAGSIGDQRHAVTANGSDGFGPGGHRSETTTSWSKYNPVAVDERASTPSWVFQEGYIPQAMRHGWWVVLDEINLAEPQVLERLNPVIEQPPSLVLSEGDGKVFGAGGSVPIAPEFHLFATMNPAEYAGRSVLSPAFRDRWLVWHQAESPGESGFAAMLRCLVFGEQPEVVFRGKRYQAPHTKPVYPALASVPGIREVLPRLALFHASLCQAGGSGGAAPTLGRLRRERYTFTRRTLLTCLQVLQAELAQAPGVPLVAHLREAVEVAYLGRVPAGADRNAAIALLRAAGLTEEPA